MKMKTRNIFLLASMMLSTLFIISCGEDEGGDPEPEPDPVFAGFEFSVADDSVVTFTNKSVGADSYEWDFGDGNSSTDENPAHTYSEVGDYTVTLTATGEGGDDTESKTVSITSSTDPNAPIQLLTGGDTKTWVLAPILHGYRFGAIDDPSTTWWGTDASHAESRPCFFNNEFTFSLDGNYTRDFNGNFWKEYLYFNACGEETEEGCLEVTPETTLENKLGADVTAWLDTDFTFTVENEVITVDGEGGYIGHYTSGRNTRDFGLVDEYHYNIVKISADTLVISGLGNTGDSNEDPECLGYEAGGLDTEGEAHALFTMTLVPKQ